MSTSLEGRRPRILLTEKAQSRLMPALDMVLGEGGYEFAGAGDTDFDVAFVSRDVTRLSTKHHVLPETDAFYQRMLNAPSLRWAHLHSAGADRPVFLELHSRGVMLSTSAGANAAVVAQTALLGILALARHFPQIMRAQWAHKWSSLMADVLPRDLEGQTVLLLGWGAIGQKLARFLLAMDLKVIVVRRSAAMPDLPGVTIVSYAELDRVLPCADWLVLACPLTSITAGLIDAHALSLLRPGARLVNVARGEVVVEPDLIRALNSGQLAGAFLDVYAHEPLPSDSPLWDFPNVITSPHSAGFSDGNETRVDRMFLENLALWKGGMPLRNQVV